MTAAHALAEATGHPAGSAQRDAEVTLELPVIDPDPTTVEWLAEPGRAELLLAKHHELRDGTCAGCPSRPVHADCWAVQAARQAVAARRWSA